MKRILILTAFLVYLAIPAAKAETIDAIAKPQEIEFNYYGKQNYYSCSGIEDKVKVLLRHIGIAGDIKVKASCIQPNSFDNSYRLTAEFESLITAPEGESGTIKAEWREVELDRSSPRSFQGGDCELVERFVKYALPSIEHQMVSGKTQCNNTYTEFLGTLKLKVLTRTSTE
jgi:hypothetical protein